ncbi:hypothetical protein V7O67_05375 [Methanolobus sp. ZRKC4]
MTYSNEKESDYIHFSGLTLLFLGTLGLTVDFVAAFLFDFDVYLLVLLMCTFIIIEGLVLINKNKQVRSMGE